MKKKNKKKIKKQKLHDYIAADGQIEVSEFASNVWKLHKMFLLRPCNRNVSISFSTGK